MTWTTHGEAGRAQSGRKPPGCGFVMQSHVHRQLGLTSAEALSVLHTQLASTLEQFKRKRKAEGTWQSAWRRSFLHHSVRWSCLHWPSVLLMLLCAVALLGCHTLLLPHSDGTALVGGCSLLLLLLAGLVAMAQLQWVKREEIPRRLQAILCTIQDYLRHPQADWTQACVELFCQPSPAISLQWTYRDGHLVNLPVILLVEGDIIALRPGAEAPTELRGIQEEEHVVLSHSDVFSHLSSPPSPLDSDRPRLHHLLQPQLFRVTKTPAVDTVQRCLELGEQRPDSVLDNERYTVQSLLERGLAPLVLVVLLLLNLARYLLGAPGVGPWPVTLLQLPVNGVLPLLPLAFPLLWLKVSLYGEIWVLTQLGAQPQGWREVWGLTCQAFIAVLCGRSPALCHTASLLHSLGSVTVLCCVDKQGILSWPSPNPEKVLFFSGSLKHRGSGKKAGMDPKNCTQQPPSPSQGSSVLELLSLSLGRGMDTRVQFDDSHWQRHNSSLRPLGLALQLATCDPGVVAMLWRQSDHLTHAALLKSRPQCQPVYPPWGLYELARVLGFRSSAQEPYQQRMGVAAYSLPTTPCAQDTAPWQSQPVSMRRQPFSHIMGLLVQDNHSGLLQLFSYGSADIVLGACAEFWDGEDLQPLTDCDRKKVLDIYQRSCMAGHCLALSFKPILDSQDPEIDGKCVELTHNPHPETILLTGEDTEKHHTGPQDLLLSLRQHIFLGLVSSQYQARPDMVRLIAGLDSACIRFVYFSAEEEVKSKVFAEKMGLETGWNCHISLQSDHFSLDPESLEENETQWGRDQGEECHLGEETRQVERTATRTLDSEGACLLGDLNRAKLPKGIENVRPHLKNIDNVPLLVPLFTDCTSQTMCEMVQIMQEYGEVVCCLGSCQNINNNAVFLQSDVSIALEPLLPSCCWTSPDKPVPPASQSHCTPFSPAHLSSALCGLPCTVHLGPQDNTAIIRLIKQARHTTAGIRKCFLFLLQCQLSVVLIQVLACVCQLPPPLGTSDVLFLSCLHFPLISVSLLGKPSDSTIMKVPTGKNLRFLPKKTQRFFVLYFLVKFGLTVCTYLACFGFMLHGFCLEINHKDDSLCHPVALLMNSSDSSPDWFGKHSDGLALAQKVIAFFVLLNAMCISVSHVHRSVPMWKQSPFSNRYWCAVLITVPILNVSIATGSRLLWHDPTPHHIFFITNITVATWLLGFLWLLPLICINEGIKLHEIRMKVRYQKRQKLQFDTKLGMNSPF
ncbi:transmembrane protein 94-like isoform X2 [Anguilla anguilla]|uniref:transmembrane protein 94-like isoform X2 n=1 Tax=Anguilla anguilla TaxID=7936 RepID=UPI0015AB2EA9|nr:transmembrane protein 94-like isoform X2 [Anguilla anguilla]